MIILMGVGMILALVSMWMEKPNLSLVVESVYGHIIKDDHPCQTALARQIAITLTEYRARSTSEEN